MLFTTLSLYSLESREQALDLLSYTFIWQLMLPPFTMHRRKVYTQFITLMFVFVVLLLVAICFALLVESYQALLAFCVALIWLLESYLVNFYLSLKSSKYRMVCISIYGSRLLFSVLFFLAGSMLSLTIVDAYVFFYTVSALVIIPIILYLCFRLNNNVHIKGASFKSYFSYYSGNSNSGINSLFVAMISRLGVQSDLAGLVDVVVRCANFVNMVFLAVNRTLVFNGRLAELYKLTVWSSSLLGGLGVILLYEISNVLHFNSSYSMLIFILCALPLANSIYGNLNLMKVKFPRMPVLAIGVCSYFISNNIVMLLCCLVIVCLPVYVLYTAPDK